MKKFATVFLLVVLVLASSGTTFAEGTPTPTTTTSSNRGKSGNERERLQQKEAELRALRDKKVEEFKARLDKKQNELKDKIASREAQLKDKLSDFKDQKKAQTAENVSTRLNQINKNKVEQMTRNVNVFDAILTKVKTRTAAAKAAGKDVSTVEPVIAAADTLIADARSAITLQAGKDYTLTATDETKIRDEAKAKRELLATDLKTTYAKVKLAREGVRKSIQAAYKTIGKSEVDVTETPTPSAAVTGTGTVTVSPTGTITLTVTGTPTPTTQVTVVPTNTTSPTPTL
jgi:hypothetical protein